ncbi:MAG: hypothetical protein ACQESR_07875 [Planctomycetota bacterium]
MLTLWLGVSGDARSDQHEIVEQLGSQVERYSVKTDDAGNIDAPGSVFVASN